jgi:O-antigen/teichoic acid export membrane protein
VSERPSYRRGLGFGAASFVTTALLALATSVVVARLYGVEVVGGFALAYAPTGVAFFLSSIREGPAVVRRLADVPPRHPRVTGVAAATFTFSMALTAVVVVLLAAVAVPVLRGPVGRPDLVAPALASLAGFLVLVNPTLNLDTVLTVFRAGDALFAVRLHQALVYLVATVALAFVAETVWALLAALYLSFLTSGVHRVALAGRWMRWRVGRDVIRAGFGELREIVVFGLKLAPGSIAYGLSHEAGVWIVGIRGTVADVGAYSRAWMVSGRLLEVNYRLTEMLLPTLAQRHTTGDEAGFASALVRSLRAVAVGLALPAAVAGGAAVGVMEVFGPGFARAADALALLLLVPLLTTLAQMQITALIALDRPATTSAMGLLRLAVTLVASVLLVGPLGIAGVALGLVCGAAAQLVVQSAITARYLRARFASLWPVRSILALPLSYGAAFAVAP